MMEATTGPAGADPPGGGGGGGGGGGDGNDWWQYPKKHIGQPVAFDEMEEDEEEYTGPDPESVWDEDGNVHLIIEPRHMRTVVASISAKD